MSWAKSPEQQALFAAYSEARKAGLSALPPSQVGSKRPQPGKKNDWREFQKNPPKCKQHADWLQSGTRTGIGIVCGAVSGNLECLDFDNRDVWEQYRETAIRVGLGDLLNRAIAGYCEHSPSGVHLLYRCSEIGANTKLAKGKETLIETRGEGGYIIVAPTYGPVHPSCKPYVLQSGSFATIPTITPEERRDLHGLARGFHVPESQELQAVERFNQEATTKGGRPGDEYNESATWADVLIPHCWQEVFTSGGTTYWRRPGKEIGISATTNYAGSDLLYVFSTSTNFEANRGYNKFSAYAYLAHGGDFSVAAKALARAGLGVCGEGTTVARMFSYTFNAADLLAAAVRVPDDAERGRWILQLALELVDADPSMATHDFAKKLINEAIQRHTTKTNSGRAGGLAKASNARAKLSTALAEAS
jgi:hypothetical protein